MSSPADIAELEASFTASFAAYDVQHVQLTETITGSSVVTWTVVTTLPEGRADGFAQDLVQQPAVMNLLNANARSMAASHAGSMFQLYSAIALSASYVGTLVTRRT